MILKVKTFLIGFLTIVGFGSAPALADSFFFDDASVNASGQQITVTRLPVRKSNGTIAYRDVTFTFKVDANGKVVVSTQKTVTSPPQILVNGALTAGTYIVQDTPGTKYTLVGPQNGLNGRAMWTLRLAGNDYFRFYAGPKSGHPFQSTIDAANIKGSYTYGTSDLSKSMSSHFFTSERLLGLSVGSKNEITIFDFGNMNDPRSLPLGHQVLKKCKTATVCS